VLHPWLKDELLAILATLPEPVILAPEENRRCWQRWQEGLTIRITLPQDLPPLRMLLVWDNLTGHYTVDLILWLFDHGIMPLFTPLGGSPRPRRRSSGGWRQQRTAGTRNRHHLCGAESGRHDASEHEPDAMPWAVQAPTPDDHSRDDGQPEARAMSLTGWTRRLNHPEDVRHVHRPGDDSGLDLA
jgi:hypothetical protein